MHESNNNTSDTPMFPILLSFGSLPQLNRKLRAIRPRRDSHACPREDTTILL